MLKASYWKPFKLGELHPIIFKEKMEAKIKKRKDSSAKILGKNKFTSKIVRKAAKAENATNKNIIKATKNSGRSLRDGDHVAANFIGLDTKLQTDRINPIVKLDELDKAINDATIRGGSLVGGLVLRNKLGAGFVVFREEDFAKHILSRLIEE